MNNENSNQKKTTLSSQKKLITVLGILAAVLLAGYILLSIFLKEEEQTVLKIDEYGDSVEAVVTDRSGRGITLGYILNVLDSGEKNKFNIKKGETEDVLCTFNADGVTITYYPLIFPEISLADFDSVTVTNEYGTFCARIDKKTGNAYIVGAEANLYNARELSELILQSRYMLSNKRIIAEENLSSYGLGADCKVKVEVRAVDGTVNTVYVGSSVTGADGYYMKHSGKDAVYVADSSVSVFFNSENYYLSPVITRTVPEEERNYFEKVVYNRNRQPFFSCEIIPEEERVGVLSNQLHRMTYPSGGYVLNTYSLYYDMFSVIGELSGVSVLEYNVSKNEKYDEIMTYYGFDEQSGEIIYTYKGNENYIVVGDSITDSETGEKYYYVYSAYMDTIVLLPLSSAPFLEYGLIDFIQAKVFQHNINDVSEIEISSAVGTRLFALEGSGNNLTVTEKKSGKTIDSDSFRQFYISLLNVNLDGYTGLSDTENLVHDLTFSVTLKSGEKLTYAFYSESTLRCYMVVDGKGEFYTKREYIDKISKNADKLMSGEKIESSF